MFLRALQRVVRMAPGPVRLAWGAVPRRIQEALGPYIHPIATGQRGGSLRIDVPEGASPRRFDVVVERVAARNDPAFTTEPRLRGHRVFELGDGSIDAFARRERVLDAVFVAAPETNAERIAAAQRFGWRVLRVGSGRSSKNGGRTLDAMERLDRAFPTVSVVVVTHSNASLCRACLNALAKNSAWPNLEVVVVDNGSTDDTRLMLERLEAQGRRFTLIFNRENQGFSSAANQGTHASRGEFVVLLNDDAAVGPGWLSRLVSRFESSERFGLVCPVTNEANNLARVPVDYATFAEMETFAENRAFDFCGAWRETEMISLFCALTRRSILESVGFLDERFAVGMFEDDDISLALKKRGLDLGIALDSFVHHVGQASFSRLEDSEYLAVWEANRRRFEEKWGVRWHPPRQDEV